MKRSKQRERTEGWAQHADDARRQDVHDTPTIPTQAEELLHTEPLELHFPSWGGVYRRATAASYIPLHKTVPDPLTKIAHPVLQMGRHSAPRVTS